MEWIPISGLPQSKRFELPKNKKAKERLDNFRDAIKRFQTTHPEVIGATVYGSMIKGKGRNKSDIDGFLYIDADMVSGEEKLKDAVTLEKEYRSNFFAEMGISPDEAQEFYHHLGSKLLSSEVLDKNIEADISYQNIEAKFWQERDEKRSSMSEKKKKAVKWPLKDPNNDDFEIGGMFHARVGTGIEKYRRMFLEKLVALPNREQADKIWRGVYAQISTMEAGDKNRKVPRELEEALQLYHPELYKSLVSKRDAVKADELKKYITDKS